jgi:hypothetical protein
MDTIPSNNATITANGFRAETAICLQLNVREALERFFNLSVSKLVRVHGKKYDIIIEFTNGTKTTLQNKDGNGTCRGWSVDRRKVDAYDNEQLSALLRTLCLKQGTDRPTISNDVSKLVINRCMLGTEEQHAPQYFTHTKSDKNTGVIISLGICSAEQLMTFMHSQCYTDMMPKLTCVHLSPNCYLQRKGGGKKDTRPDNIQMKVKWVEPMECLFVQTMSLSPAQKLEEH